MNIQRFRIAGMIAGLLIAFTALFDPAARATTTFLIPDLTMTDGFAGDPLLTVSGTFTVPSLGTVLSSLNPEPNPASVAFSVKDGSHIAHSFNNPLAFGYTSGMGADGRYTVDLETNDMFDIWYFLAFTIYNYNLVGADFADLSGRQFVHGYYTENPLPVAEVLSAPEPASLLLLGTALTGLVGIGARRMRRSQRHPQRRSIPLI